MRTSSNAGTKKIKGQVPGSRWVDGEWHLAPLAYHDYLWVPLFGGFGLPLFGTRVPVFLRGGFWRGGRELGSVREGV